MKFHENPTISSTGQYNADCWAEGKTDDELRAMIVERDKVIPKGIDGNAAHDYAWVVTLRTILDERKAS